MIHFDWLVIFITRVFASNFWQAAIERKGTFKVEFLQKIEQDVQAKWEQERVYEFDAPAEPRTGNDEKYMVTFPYPYMNGRLHLGHTFSLSKAEVNEQKICAQCVEF